MIIRKKIDPAYTEKEITVFSCSEDRELQNIMDALQMMFGTTVSGTDQRGNRVNARLSDVISFFSENGKVKAHTTDGDLTLPRTMYSLEEELPEDMFFRISRSEIINIRRIRKLDMSFAGTIKVIMNDGYETYVSRRNVTGLKKLLVGKERK